METRNSLGGLRRHWQWDNMHHGRQRAIGNAATRDSDRWTYKCMAAVLRNGPVGVDKKTICLSFCDGLRRAGAWTAEIRSYGDRKTMTGLPSLALRV
jgi:hypothetical protein